ncbi:hypothetical protein J522_2268 [Acinetobacter baumannii 146457]|nr:hypothetical protein J522_2268 [Acinetobacter baumannii 146457]
MSTVQNNNGYNLLIEYSAPSHFDINVLGNSIFIDRLGHFSRLISLC